MKKIFITLFTLFLLTNTCFARDGISFIYINGSNNNDLKMKNWYENGVKKLHPCLKSQFESNQFIQNTFLKNNKSSINKEPVIFFWGDKSQKDLALVKQELAISKGISPWAAFQVRKLLAQYLHDAIWVQKFYNMAPVLSDLHKYVINEYNKGNDVVLYGYSAGTFVTYNYLLTRIPYVNVLDFFKTVGISESKLKFVKEHPVNDTCMSALGKDVAVFSATGNIIPNILDDETFKKNYMNLNNLTASLCVPDKAVKGIVNFASPLVLFYSGLADPDYEINYYNRLLFEYIIENDLFWITVNYREDPLGFPVGRNLSVEEIEGIINLEIDPHAGFIYDLSSTKSKRTFMTAHTAYWVTHKRFSKAVVNAYISGYLHKKDECASPLKKRGKTEFKP